MVIINRCQYETTKDSVSNLVALINRYHPEGEMIPTVSKNKVRFSVISSASTDFYNILPRFNFSEDNCNLDKDQIYVKGVIENIFFLRLRYKNNDIQLNSKYNSISFDKLIQIASTLKYSTKIYPIHTEEIIYIGIGSKKLGYYIMVLHTDHITDGSYPKFNLEDGFIDPFLDGTFSQCASNESMSTRSRYTILNHQFKKWKDSGCKNNILDTNKMKDLLEINVNK